MKKLCFIIVLTLICPIFVGCGSGSKELSFARLEIYSSFDANISLKRAIYELDEELSKIMLADYDALSEVKVANFCKSVLIKWQVDAPINVAIYKELKTIKIWVGEDAEYLSCEKNIMQALN